MIPDYKYVTSADDLPQIAREIERTKLAGFDIETTSYEPYDIDERGEEGAIRLFAIDTGLGVYVVDLFQTGGLGPILPALACEDVIKIIQNGQFEQKWFLYKYDVELWPVFDTFRASVLIHNGRGMEHHLWALIERELFIVPQSEDLGGGGWLNPILTKDQKDYSAEDVAHLIELREELKKQLQQHGLLQTALIEFGAILPEAAVELNGIPLDRDMWLELAADNVVLSQSLKDELIWKMPNPTQQIGLPGITPGINLDSPLQVLNSLRKLGSKLSDLENTREITLAMFAAEFPLIKELLEYRGVSKHVTQFGEKYLEHLHPVTGRIHSHYYPFTEAGRYACAASWTPVRTRGGVKSLVSVKVGDQVWTHRNRWRKVTRFLHQGVQETFDVRFSNGQTLTCTGSHRLLTSGNEWVTVKELYERFQDLGSCGGESEEGDRSLSQSEDSQNEQFSPSNKRGTQTDTFYAGEGQPFVSIEEINPRGSIEVYDLTVEDDESYEACGVFSHNCSNPNLQQVPRDPRFRYCFRAWAGRRICGADYSNVEMRACAQITRDKRLMEIFNSVDDDVHRATAALLAGIPPEQVNALQRQSAKPINFGLIFGMMAFKLVLYAMSEYGVAMTLKEAKKYRAKFFSREAYAGVARWHQLVINDMQPTGIARTLSGRLRHMKEDAHNEWFNTPIQGSCADGLKSALRCVYLGLKKEFGSWNGDVKMMHHVHDEILLDILDDPEVDRRAQQILCEGMQEGMEQFIKDVPVKVEPSSGASWGDVK